MGDDTMEIIGPDSEEVGREAMIDAAPDLVDIDPVPALSCAAVRWEDRPDAVVPMRIVTAAVERWESARRAAGFEYRLLSRVADGEPRFEDVDEYLEHVARRCVRRLAEDCERFVGLDLEDYRDGVGLMRTPGAQSIAGAPD